jgi:hypothetical protein
MADALMAGGYCWLFFLMLRHPLHEKLGVFMAACAYSCIYSTGFGGFAYWPVLPTVSRIVWLLPLIEAAWQVLRDKRAGRLLSVHLALQALWTVLHAVSAIAYPLILTTRPRWDAARWVYVAGALAIIWRYQIEFRRRNPAERAEEAEEAEDRLPV